MRRPALGCPSAFDLNLVDHDSTLGEYHLSGLWIFNPCIFDLLVSSKRQGRSLRERHQIHQRSKMKPHTRTRTQGGPSDLILLGN